MAFGPATSLIKGNKMECEICHSWIDETESVYIKQDGSEQFLCWECATVNFNQTEEIDNDW
jgi:ribosome-binding protein aMBF1 (putative translation factor)